MTRFHVEDHLSPREILRAAGNATRKVLFGQPEDIIGIRDDRIRYERAYAEDMNYVYGAIMAIADVFDLRVRDVAERTGIPRESARYLEDRLRAGQGWVDMTSHPKSRLSAKEQRRHRDRGYQATTRMWVREECSADDLIRSTTNQVEFLDRTARLISMSRVMFQVAATYRDHFSPGEMAKMLGVNQSTLRRAERRAKELKTQAADRVGSGA